MRKEWFLAFFLRSCFPFFILFLLLQEKAQSIHPVFLATLLYSIGVLAFILSKKKAALSLVALDFIYAFFIFLCGLRNHQYLSFIFLLPVLGTNFSFGIRFAFFLMLGCAAISLGFSAFYQELTAQVLEQVLYFFVISILMSKVLEEWLKSERKLFSLEKINEGLLQFMETAYVITNGGNKVLQTNAVFLQIFNKKNEECVGQNVQAILPGIQDLDFSKGKNSKDWLVDGNIRKFLVQCRDLEEQKFFFIRDLTEIFEMEKKLNHQERLAYTGLLASGIAHEIRNPLASIFGAVQLLQDHFSEDDPEARSLLSIVSKEVERIERLIKKLLQFSKSRIEIEKREILNLAPLIEEALSLLKLQPEIQEAQFNFQLTLEKDVFVRASKDEIFEILNNLILNAAQSFSEKQMSEKLIQVNLCSKGNKACLSVRDNGPGMAEAVAKRVFDPFFTTKKIGTGLGLAQVFKIVQNLKGNIRVESELGKGTVFHLELLREMR